MSKYEKPTLNEVEVEKIIEENQKLRQENEELKEERKQLRADRAEAQSKCIQLMMGQSLGVVDETMQKWKPCYEAMKIIKKKFFVDYNPNELGLIPVFDNGNPKYASITSEEYKIFRKVFEAIKNE